MANDGDARDDTTYAMTRGMPPMRPRRRVAGKAASHVRSTGSYRRATRSPEMRRVEADLSHCSLTSRRSLELLERLLGETLLSIFSK